MTLICEDQSRSEARASSRRVIPGVNVTICVQEEPKLTETFIQAHIDHLPANVTVVHGRTPRIGDRPIVRPTTVRHGLRLLWGKLRHGTTDWPDTLAYIRAFRRTRPRVVLAEYGPMGHRVLLACMKARIPLVTHFHGYDAFNREVLAWHSSGYRRLFQHAAAIVAVSRHMRDQLVELGAPSERVFYNPYGVDCQRLTGAAPETAPARFIAVGRFVEKKAPHLTLLAFSQVLRNVPSARLVMIGDGPLLGVCQDLAYALDVSHAVRFMGPQANQVVIAEIRKARCFVQHSVEAANGDCEGTPVAIIEAGAAGLPVVATRHAGIPDVVVHGETGWLVAEKDVRAMADRMTRIATEPELAASFGAAAAVRIREQFNLPARIAELWRIISAAGRIP